MIFSKNIYKLVSGKNLTLFSEGQDLYIFIYKNITKKYKINLEKNEKAELVSDNLSYNQITKLNGEHSCVFYDKTISIIENEKENI